MTSIFKNSFASFLFISSILLFIYSCKKDLPIEKNQNIPQLQVKEDLPQLQDVYLFATSNNKSTLESVGLIDFSLLVGQPEPHYTKMMRGDTLVIKLPGITQSQIIELTAFGSSNFYNTRALIHPEDSIYFHLEQGKITFSKTRSTENNFFSNMSTPEAQWPNFNGDITAYKNDVIAIRNTRKKILDSYIKKHPEVSDTFIDMVTAEMSFEYLLQLVNPRSVVPPSASLKTNFNNTEGVLSTLRSSEYDSEKGMLDFTEYYDQISIEDFQKPEYANNGYFRWSLRQLIRHHFVEYEYLNYSKETFLAEKKFIDEHLKGDLKTYTLGRLIYDYNEKGFGRGAKDLKVMQNAIAELTSRTDKFSYEETMNTIKTSLEAIGTKIPDHILKEKLLTTTLDTITVGEVLQNTKGKIRTLDFWASWCAPCLREMKNTVGFKKNLAVQYDTDWIYISADEDQEKWLKKTKQLKNHIPQEKQYRFVTPYKSKLLKLLKARKKTTIYVPRYTILDSNNNIALAIAPFPSDSITFKKDIQEISHKQ